MATTFQRRVGKKEEESETESIGYSFAKFAPTGQKKWGWESVADMKSGMKGSFFKIGEIA